MELFDGNREPSPKPTLAEILRRKLKPKNISDDRRSLIQEELAPSV